jgi:hypothetical protein
MRRRWNPRQVRSRLFWALGAFAALQAALAVGVDSFWRAVRDPEYAAREQALRRRLAEAPGRPLVLFLGSSRTLADVRADLLSSAPDGPLAYNFGIGGGGPIAASVCLRRLLGAGVRPDLVFVEVTPPFLNQSGGPMEESYLDPARFSLRELARVRPYYSRPTEWLPRWLYARLLPCYRHQAELRDALGRALLLGAAAPPLDPCFGWQPNNRSATPEERRHYIELVRNQFKNAVKDYRLAPGMARALRDLLGLCRREKIAVALITLPEGSAFRGFYPEEMKADVNAFLAGLARDADAPLIDARTWIDDDGFWDAHHLLPAGATAFTERFEREALRPLLRQSLMRSPRQAGGHVGSNQLQVHSQVALRR